MRRPTLVLLAALLMSTVIGIAPTFATEDGEADPTSEQTSLSLVNQERTSRGLPALKWHTEAASVARAHSHDMAGSGELHHNTNVGSEVHDWRELAENVGEGPTAEAIHDAFMNSANHRANILDDDFTHAGIGAVVKDGTLWVTQVLLEPSSSSSSNTSTTSRREITGSSVRKAPRAQPSSAYARPRAVRAAAVVTAVERPAPRARRASSGTAEGTVAMLERITEEDSSASNGDPGHCGRKPC